MCVRKGLDSGGPGCEATGRGGTGAPRSCGRSPCGTRAPVLHSWASIPWKARVWGGGGAGAGGARRRGDARMMAPPGGPSEGASSEELGEGGAGRGAPGREQRVPGKRTPARAGEPPPVDEIGPLNHGAPMLAREASPGCALAVSERGLPRPEAPRSAVYSAFATLWGVSMRIKLLGCSHSLLASGLDPSFLLPV